MSYSLLKRNFFFVYLIFANIVLIYYTIVNIFSITILRYQFLFLFCCFFVISLVMSFLSITHVKIIYFLLDFIFNDDLSIDYYRGIEIYSKMHLLKIVIYVCISYNLRDIGNFSSSNFIFDVMTIVLLIIFGSIIYHYSRKEYSIFFYLIVCILPYSVLQVILILLRLK